MTDPQDMLELDKVGREARRKLYEENEVQLGTKWEADHMYRKVRRIRQMKDYQKKGSG